MFSVIHPSFLDGQLGSALIKCVYANDITYIIIFVHMSKIVQIHQNTYFEVWPMPVCMGMRGLMYGSDIQTVHVYISILYDYVHGCPFQPPFGHVKDVHFQHHLDIAKVMSVMCRFAGEFAHVDIVPTTSASLSHREYQRFDGMFTLARAKENGAPEFG